MLPSPPNCGDRTVTDYASAVAHERRHLADLEDAVRTAMEAAERTRYPSKAACTSALQRVLKSIEQVFNNEQDKTQAAPVDAKGRADRFWIGTRAPRSFAT